jgi:hypothetical protein
MSFEVGGVEVLSLDEVSQKLGVKRASLLRCIRQGELVARKVGGSWFVTSKNLLAFLQSATAQKPHAPETAEARPPAPSHPAPAAARPTSPATADREAPAPAAPEPVPPAAGNFEVPTAFDWPGPDSAVVPAKPASGIRNLPPGVPHDIATRPTDPLMPAAKLDLAPSITERPTEPTLPSAPATFPIPAALPPPVDDTPAPQPPPSSGPAEPLPALVEDAPPPAVLPPPVPEEPIPSPFNNAAPPAPPAADPPPPAPNREVPGPDSPLGALFDLPTLPADPEVLHALNLAPGPEAVREISTREETYRRAVEATRRRASEKGEGFAAPGTAAPRRSLLDSEEMPVPVIDMPGSAKAPDTRPVVAVKPAETSSLDALSEVPDMFGPDAPTVLIRPGEAAAAAPPMAEPERETLLEAVEQGRVAQRARDELVTTIRRLSPEEQSRTLAGPVGDQLVKLDRLIEEGVRAQKDLGTSPDTPPGVISAIGVRSSAPGGASAPGAPPGGIPLEVRREEDSKWLPLEEASGRDVAKPVTAEVPAAGKAESLDLTPAPRPPTRTGRPASSVRADARGGETWQEVGLPAPAGAHRTGNGREESRVERLTFGFSDDERRVLEERSIREDDAVRAIMRDFSPTNEIAWERAKERYFSPLR